MEIRLEARTADLYPLTDREDLPPDAEIDIGGGVRLHHLGTQRFLDGSVPNLVAFAVVAAGAGAGVVASTIWGYLALVAGRMRESRAVGQTAAGRIRVRLRCGGQDLKLVLESDMDSTALRPLLDGFLAGCGGPPGSPGADRDPDRIDFRLGFVLDIAGYSVRSSPDQKDVQRRLLAMVREVLGDVAIDPDSAAIEGRGDGLIVMLPAGAQFHRVLPVLLRTTAQRLALDNRRHAARIRLRMAAGIGPVGRGAIGFTEQTAIEICRLVDSDELRQALSGEPDADLAVLVSNALYGYVVGAGHPGLEPSEFRPVHVTVKTFEAAAWLWAPTP